MDLIVISETIVFCFSVTNLLEPFWSTVAVVIENRRPKFSHIHCFWNWCIMTGSCIQYRFTFSEKTVIPIPVTWELLPWVNTTGMYTVTTTTLNITAAVAKELPVEVHPQVHCVLHSYFRNIITWLWPVCVKPVREICDRPLNEFQSLRRLSKPSKSQML